MRKSIKPNKLHYKEDYFVKKSQKIVKTKNRRGGKRKESIFERKKPTKRSRNSFQAQKVTKEVKRQKEISLSASGKKLFEKLAEEKIINENRLAMKKEMSSSIKKHFIRKAGYSGKIVTKQVNVAKYDENTICNVITTKNEHSLSKTCLKEERKFKMEEKIMWKIENSFSNTAPEIDDQYSSESSEEEDEDDDDEWWKEKKEDKGFSREELNSENYSMVYCSDSSDSECGIVLEDLSEDEIDDNCR